MYKNLYNYLKNLEYKLPEDWFPMTISEIKHDMLSFVKSKNVNLEEYYNIIAVYDDKRFNKVLNRLVDGK
jgi:hypothetical protein